MTTDFTLRLRAAADYIETHGWVQRTEEDVDGRVCLTGAVKLCSPQAGDFHLIREVLWVRGRAESWNDAEDRTSDEVVEFLRTAEITDVNLANTFGPQWESIVALVRRAAILTLEDAEQLASARYATRYATWNAAWNSVRDVAWDLARERASSAAGSAAKSAAWHATVAAARSKAAWDAMPDTTAVVAMNSAWALGVRDLIGQNDFTADRYRTLTAPWVSVCGPVHLDDIQDGLA